MSLDYGLRISQPGYDVKTCTDAQCSLTSKLNSFKIPLTLQGTASITVPHNSSATVTINHNLGYMPVFLSWWEDENGVWHTIFENNQLGTSTDLFASVLQYEDTSNIYLKLLNRSPSSDRTTNIYYIIFLEVSN